MPFVPYSNESKIWHLIQKMRVKRLLQMLKCRLGLHGIRQQRRVRDVATRRDRMRLIKKYGIMCLVVVAATSQSRGASEIGGDERQALLALYDATGGERWHEHSGWLGPEGSECRWFGVTCGAVDGRLKVTDVVLNNNGLTGKLPQELSKLNGLQRINLQGNEIKGPLPDVLLQKFDRAQLQ